MTENDILHTLDQKKVVAAADYIAKATDRETLLSFLNAIYEDPESWWVQWHLHGSMGLRNYMREGGFGEKDMGVENLDDIYLPIFYKALTKRAMEFILSPHVEKSGEGEERRGKARKHDGR